MYLSCSPVSFDISWTHLTGLPLADPSFGHPTPNQHFGDILCQGRWTGPIESPIAIEMEFRWVLCSYSTPSGDVNLHVTLHHAAIVCSNDILQNFWEVQGMPSDQPTLTLEERSVL